jgi:putative peptidoglycan lipid II flippase
MAAGTLLSRVTGLARTAALAAALGATSLADAYNVANTVPTILLVLVTGGTLSAVLVPMLVRTDDLDERRRRAESLGALVLAVTAAAALLAVLLAPLLARFFALGLRGDDDYDDFVRVATLLLVLFAPQVLAYGLSVHAVAVLQAAGRLALAGVAPVATNLVTISAVALYLASGATADIGDVDTGPLLLLGVGTTVGVVAMAGLQLLGARRVLPGMRVLRRPRLDDTGRELLHLGRWTLLYVGANQAGLAVVLVLATSLSGGASAYQWAFALMQLPFAVVAVSVLSALYPRVARAAGRDEARYAALLAAGLRTLLLLLVPAALALGLLAEPVVRLLLGYGAVDDAGVALIAAALRSFAVALLPFTAFQLLTRAHYARGDTRTPALVNVAVNAVNVVGAGLAVAFAGSAEQALGGLAAAYAASYVAGCLLLGRTLRRRTDGGLAGVARLTVRLLPAAASTAAVIVLSAALGRGLAGDGRAGDVTTLLFGGLVGGTAWTVAALLLARSEVSAVVRQFRR